MEQDDALTDEQADPAHDPLCPRCSGSGELTLYDAEGDPFVTPCSGIEYYDSEDPLRS